MSLPDQQAGAPVCYRHPEIHTWVACGKCGRPLCPDCLRHGPVGIRCDECLYPQGPAGKLVTPERMHAAQRAGLLMAGGWTLALVALGVLTHSYAPNLVLAMLAGGLVGWIVWRKNGRAWNSFTRRWTLLVGAAMPLVAALALTAIGALTRDVRLSMHFTSVLGIVTLVARTLCAAGLSALFAWLLSTQRSGLDTD